MKSQIHCTCLLLVLGTVASVSAIQSAPPSSTPANAQFADNSSQNAELEKVLSRMDTTAASFRGAEANFEWDQYTKVVDETDKQTGKIYFRRSNNQIEMAAEITSSNGKPLTKYVLFADGKVQVYQPSISNQIDEYSTGKNREAVESFLVLGFGGSGHAMLKSFVVSYLGPDQDVAGAVKLNLVPKDEKVHNMFDHIILWIDSIRGISVQQQLFTGQGDYRLAKYSDIKLNEKISDSVFKPKMTGKTQVVSH
ncbi:MAG TPA: outer membrane lipoprotein-sorting protein [Terriglobales bacterium]|nr:outer membrane lipoprotein-sorting protein [Terriglobales bacterium]